MKGILLAGGRGSRLYPMTSVISKQLLPVYDKPMIYYPLSVLMQANIREILIISTKEDLPRFHSLLGSGSELGLSFSYEEQKEPKGIAEALIIGESFIGKESVALILGDNIFYGHSLSQLLRKCGGLQSGAAIFGYQVNNPSRYGVVAFDEKGLVTDLIEKPQTPPSHYAVTGLYFYDHQAPLIAKSLKPSSRGELEITDVNRFYLQKGELQLHLFDRGFAWLDTGTPEDLYHAASYVHTLQARQGIQIACIEEIAYQMGFITKKEYLNLAAVQQKNGYGHYLQRRFEG